MIRLCAFADESAYDLLQQISALKRNNVHLLELRSINGVNVKDFTLTQAQEYARILRQNDVTVFSIGSPLGKVDISQDFNDYLHVVEHVCRLANVFNTDKIRVFSFFNAYEHKKEVFARLKKMVEVASAFGVKLYHENEKFIFGDTASRVCELLDNVKGLRSIYDPANFIEVGEPSSVTLDLLHHKADYFHIKDVISATGELVPAGFGDGNLPELVRKIGHADKVLSVEPHLFIFNAYKDIDSTKLKNKFSYADSNQAFDSAISALKNLLIANNYHETPQGFTLNS